MGFYNHLLQLLLFLDGVVTAIRIQYHIVRQVSVLEHSQCIKLFFNIELTVLPRQLNIHHVKLSSSGHICRFSSRDVGIGIGIRAAATRSKEEGSKNENKIVSTPEESSPFTFTFLLPCEQVG